MSSFWIKARSAWDTENIGPFASFNRAVKFYKETFPDFHEKVKKEFEGDYDAFFSQQIRSCREYKERRVH